MATHSGTLAWKIPWMEEPGRLHAIHGIAKSRTRLSDFTFTFLHWRRKWQPTPVFLPGASQGRGSLEGCRLWGRTESDTTEATQQQQLPPRISFSQTLKHGRILDTHTIEASPCARHTLSLTDQRVKILGFWPQHSILP